MNFLNKLFSNTNDQKECPRCLGKGHLDAADIIRLNKELKWKPGTCAYCNSTGKVDAAVEAALPPDTSYLTTDLDETERHRLLCGDPMALARAGEWDERVDLVITQICYLHNTCGLSASQIADFYMLSPVDGEDEAAARQELVEYIEEVIADRISKS